MIRKRHPIPKEYVDKTFSYDPLTGVVTRTLWNGTVKTVGFPNNHGHLRVNIDHKHYYLHRIIWYLQTGDDPGEAYVDHINGDRADNRWSNLRLTDAIGNAQNASARGGHLNKDGKYTAMVYHLGKYYYAGHSFDTQEEASEAYWQLKRQLCGDYTREQCATTATTS